MSMEQAEVLISALGCLESVLTHNYVWCNHKTPEIVLNAELWKVSSTLNTKLNYLYLIYSNSFRAKLTQIISPSPLPFGGFQLRKEMLEK